jgi:hypothetical protein
LSICTRILTGLLSPSTSSTFLIASADKE